LAAWLFCHEINQVLHCADGLKMRNWGDGGIKQWVFAEELLDCPFDLLSAFECKPT
jgi:hypothetical protein